MTKLIELFEAIPDTVEVCDMGEERMVQLTRDKMIWVIGEQVDILVGRFHLINSSLVG